MSDIVEALRELTSIRYMADCKCGNCQLVPREVVNGAAVEISRLRAIIRALRQGAVDTPPMSGQPKVDLRNLQPLT